MASRLGYSQKPCWFQSSHNLCHVLMPMILPSQLFPFASLMLALSPAFVAVDSIAGLNPNHRKCFWVQCGSDRCGDLLDWGSTNCVEFRGIKGQMCQTCGTMIGPPDFPGLPGLPPPPPFAGGTGRARAETVSRERSRPRSQSPEPQPKQTPMSDDDDSHHRMGDNDNGPDRVIEYILTYKRHKRHRYHQFNQWLSKSWC